jgi:hypothetical protein
MSLVAVIARLYRLDDPITSGGWSFRFTQTAYGIRSLVRGGLDPFTMEVPVLGPPWQIPFEFPIFQFASAVIARLTSWDPVTAGRLVATIAFASVGVTTYALTKAWFGFRAAITAYVIVIWSAYGINWGSEVLIDYLSVALCMWGTIALHRSLARRRWRTTVLAIVPAALGALTKATTAYSWVLVVGLAALWFHRRDLTRVMQLVVWLGMALTPTLAWNRYADSVKAANPHTGWLTSWNLNEHHFRSPRELMEASQWRSLVEHSLEPSVGSVLIGVVFITLAVLAPWSARPARLVLALLIAPPLTFTGLYLAHDYYFIAIAPAFAMLAGVAVEVIRRFIAMQWKTAVSVPATVVAAALVVGLSWISPEGVENLNNSLPGSAAEAMRFDEVVEATSPDDRILVVGMDWSPVFLYTVDRKGLMLRPNGSRPEAGELGTFYEFVYWAEPDPTAEQWAEYFPPELRYEPISANFYRIFPLTN